MYKRQLEDQLVIQYEVTLTEGLTCGGAYIKLFPSTVRQATLRGPDPPSFGGGRTLCTGVGGGFLMDHPLVGDVIEPELRRVVAHEPPLSRAVQLDQEVIARAAPRRGVRATLSEEGSPTSCARAGIGRGRREERNPAPVLVDVPPILKPAEFASVLFQVSYLIFFKLQLCLVVAQRVV